MRAMKLLAATAAVALLITACANQKEPAEKAVSQVEASLSQFKEDASKYAADDLRGVEESIAKLKGELADKNYKAVVMQTPNVASTVAALKDTVAKKKAEAEEMLAAAQQEWTDLSASVPEMVTKLQSKVDSFTKSRKLPKGLDKAAFDSAKADFESLKSSWAEASAEFSSGMVADAVRRARARRPRVRSWWRSSAPESSLAPRLDRREIDTPDDHAADARRHRQREGQEVVSPRARHEIEHSQAGLLEVAVLPRVQQGLGLVGEQALPDQRGLERRAQWLEIGRSQFVRAESPQMREILARRRFAQRDGAVLAERDGAIRAHFHQPDIGQGQGLRLEPGQVRRRQQLHRPSGVSRLQECIQRGDASIEEIALALARVG